MVVVNDGNDLIGHAVRIEVQSILPSAGGKIVLRGLWAQVKRHNHPLLFKLEGFYNVDVTIININQANYKS